MYVASSLTYYALVDPRMLYDAVRFDQLIETVRLLDS